MLFLKSKEYIQSSERVDVIVEAMIEEKYKLIQFIKSCDLVGELKHKKPKSISSFMMERADSNEPYWILNQEINDLRYKLMTQTSTTADWLDIYKVYQDELSKKLYPGTYSPPYIQCDAETIQINDDLMTYDRNRTYKISTTDKVKIEYNRYKISKWPQMIDTTTLTRYIDFNIEKIK